ncbi:hypothetical protein ACIQM4_17100 [Streptomyces sp. NPDC091272]|uniref:hypothetical protein n=1 Tax=Streptomyces sp. NPDC091272 TaxID=3365981 RepID=UPI003821FB37
MALLPLLATVAVISVFPVLLLTEIFSESAVETFRSAGAPGPGDPPWVLPGVGSAANAPYGRRRTDAAATARHDPARFLTISFPISFPIFSSISQPPYSVQRRLYLQEYHKIAFNCAAMVGS